MSLIVVQYQYNAKSALFSTSGVCRIPNNKFVVVWERQLDEGSIFTPSAPALKRQTNKNKIVGRAGMERKINQANYNTGKQAKQTANYSCWLWLSIFLCGELDIKHAIFVLR